MKKKEISEEQRQKNILLSDTIFLFTPINEGVPSLYGRPIERKATTHLLNKYGIEKIKNMLAFIPTYNKGLKPTKTGKIFGKILKPSQLVEYIQDLIDAKKKFDREINFQLQKEEIRKREIEEAQELKKLQDSYTLEEKELMRKERNDQMRKSIGF